MASNHLISRETVVYHQADEETPLNPKPTRFESMSLLHPALILKQQRIYSAITLADIFQKIVYTTVILSLLSFLLRTLNLVQSLPLILYFAFATCSWFVAALVNLYGDMLLERRNCIVAGFSLYFIGVATLSALIVNMYIDPLLFKYLMIGPFAIICFAEAFCKTAIGRFGQDQFKDPKLSSSLQSFSLKLFWVGHTCALLVIAFLLGILEFARYEIGMGLCCVCLAAGLLSFFTAWKNFQTSDTLTVKPLVFLYKIYKAAKWNEKVFKQERESAGIFHESLARKGTPSHWLDFAQTRYNGKYSESVVNECKSLLKMTVIFLALIPYWICNAQGYSTFIYQAMHLNTNIGEVDIPAPWMALFNIVAVLLFVQLLEKLIYPCLLKRGYSFPTSWRIILGIVLAGCSMLFAAGVQLYLYKNTNNSDLQVTSYERFNITISEKTHIVWTMPQFIFLGVSEVLVGLTSLSLACKLCPNHFQRHVISFYYVMIAIGNAVGLLIFLIGQWFPSENYFGSLKMVIFFFSLAMLAIFDVLVFIVVVSRQSPTPKNQLVFNTSPRQESVL